MVQKIMGMWGFNKETDGVKGMYVNTTTNPALWLYGERGGVQSWRLDSDAKASANKVRTSAKAYALAWSGVRVADSDMRYVVEEIGEVPEAVLYADYAYVAAENDTRPSGYTLNAIDVKHGWKIGADRDGHVLLSRDVSFLSPADYEAPESFEDDAEAVEPEQSETPERSEQSESVDVALHGHTIAEFAQVFDDIYGMLYDSEVSPNDYGAAAAAFDNGEYPRNVLTAFNRYREDCVSSDREAAAFIMALHSRDMTTPKTVVDVKPVEPEAVTREIPEVPPATEPHEVVRTSSAVVVRKVTIPGGKSVRELADVFGMYSHKPRGFRDSKGRRVAYVAFDKSGGVIAYRDFYRRDAQVERDIAVYLKLHGLRLAA